MLLYIIALCGFSSALGSIVSNVGTFCVMLPVLTVVSLVLSPVFFDLMQLKAIQVLLPMYHYLYAASGVGSIGYFALYAVAASAISYALFVLTVRIRYQSSAKSAKLR